MIYAWNVLKAYTALRGTYVYHLPMAIAMLVFIRIPRGGNYDVEFPLAWVWYTTSVVLHFLQSFIHLSEFFEPENRKMFLPVREIAKIFTIFFQAINFILLATLYGESSEVSELT